MSARDAMKFAENILDILFPPCCAGCQKSGYILCSSCIMQISPLPAPVCRHCSTPLTTGGICKQCQYHPLKLSRVHVVGAYQEPLRSCIHALKYNSNTRVAEPLGQLLAENYINCDLHADVVIPVPLHSERQKQRGYNHAYLLAHHCAARIGVPLRNDVLVRHRATPAQVGLSPVERRENVAGAFLCTRAFATRAFHGRTILLIDDVYTTGATLEACAAPLFAAGAAAVRGLVLARPV